jgi:hypothetical protein|tara:strand:+ start:321 stop:671 length:351 start_codon:yes stop_codon:yes gene_type:complete
MSDIAALNEVNAAGPKHPKPNTIVISARRWFRKGPGNTYHSATIWVDGVEVEGIEYAYGYGDHYLCTSASKLDTLGYMPGREYRESGSHESLYTYCDRMGISFTYSVSDVKRKKDL